MTRVLVFGALGPYTSAFTRALVKSAHNSVNLLGCVVRRPIGEGIERWFRNRLVAMQVDGYACPVWSSGATNEPKLYDRLSALDADLVVVVGFPRKLPADRVNRLAKFGAVNVHPALLPRDRGPLPLFWAYRRGDKQTGVSVHALTNVVDGGDLLGQATLDIPFGSDGGTIFSALGTLGGDFVARLLPQLAQPVWHLQPQGEAEGPWAKRPSWEDFQITPAEWTAARLYHFARGVKPWGTPWARLADDVYYFAEALSFDEGRKLPGEFVVWGDRLMLAVNDGVVEFKLTKR